MNRCELVTSLLAEYAADELQPMQRAIVAEHLAECPTCHAELIREQQLRELMTDLPEAPCPAEVTAAITGAVDAEPAPRRRGRPRLNTWSGAAAAASLVAAAVLLVLVLPPSGTTPGLDPDDTQSWTQDELDRAREDAQWALAFTANVIEQSEKQTIVDVMRRLQKEAFAGFRDRNESTSPGGRG